MSHFPNSAKRFLRKRFRSFEVTQRLTPRTQQNAFYESVLGRSTDLIL
ncbi:hypothetical protein MAL08_10980 [Leptospira noguchii]|nr:hypothetical protein [Leptospira noguchii]UOG36644.1 hypothetical protein MAL08_10980 [Leptospira noguchii]